MPDTKPTPASPAATLPSKKWLWVLALVLILGGFFYFSNVVKTTKNKDKAGVNKPIPVVVATAKEGDIRVYLNGLGTVTPLATVTVKSRVDGEIVKIYFKEGQMVKGGEVLVEIDPRPFQAALTQAEGQLMRDKALLADARLDLARYETLLKQESIASQQVDTQRALVKQFEGTVKMDQGLFDTAKLNLTYSKVTAPVSGRVGLRQVDIGNIVHASDANGIVIITQLQPMSVLFSLPEDSIPKLVAKMNVDKKLTVNAFDRAFQKNIATGYLQTIDNQIDPTTGMVKLRAEFKNEALNLFPSQFVNAQILLETKRNVVTAPNPAVQHGRDGSFVFVVSKDYTVKQRNIVVGTVDGHNTEVVSGLISGDMVVTDGVDKLRDGTKVDISSSLTKSTHKP